MSEDREIQRAIGILLFAKAENYYTVSEKTKLWIEEVLCIKRDTSVNDYEVLIEIQDDVVIHTMEIK